MPVTTHTSHSGFRAMHKIATIQVSSWVHPENPGELRRNARSLLTIDPLRS
jgi:hypothetical protein